MAHSELLNKLNDIVAPIVDAAHLFLESVRVKRAGKYTTLIVTVDLEYGPGSVDSEKLEEVSREISAVLDRADLISGSYTLEVSTPGAERSLTDARLWSRAIGRMVQIEFLDGTAVEGRVKELNSAGPLLTPYVLKNKQRVETADITVNFEQIKRAHIVVEI